MSDHELDKIEITLMVDIEDKNVTKKELISTCKKSLDAIRYLRKELDFYNEEYYLPDDAPDYFKKEHLTEKECKNAKFDVIHHTVGDGIVTLHHYLYRSRIMAFHKYVMLMSKYVDDFVEMNRYNIAKVEAI